jgi:hypothetical protein
MVIAGQLTGCLSNSRTGFCSLRSFDHLPNLVHKALGSNNQLGGSPLLPAGSKIAGDNPLREMLPITGLFIGQASIR